MNIFYKKWFLTGLVVANLLGTIWGIIWYWSQLGATPWYLLPFVPDSPLHAMLFGLFIYWLLTPANKMNFARMLICWAGVLGVIKYGLWTTVILSQYLLVIGSIPSLEDLMLFASHGGMALQGLVYANRLPRQKLAPFLAVGWFACNDLFDYVFMTHPRLPLAGQVPVACWTGVALTVLVAVIAHFLIGKKCKTGN